MALNGPVGIWFSELGKHMEQRDYYFTGFSGNRKKDSYWYCGDLPDGRHYGWRYFKGNYAWGATMMICIVEKTGESLATASAKGTEDTSSRPTAVCASPGGRCLVWIIDGQLWIWRRTKDGFIIEDAKCLASRFEGRLIRDARMNPDGILELKCEDGSTAAYFCDADIVLLPS